MHAQYSNTINIKLFPVIQGNAMQKIKKMSDFSPFIGLYHITAQFFKVAV